jgi:hypothetical protein
MSLLTARYVDNGVYNHMMFRHYHQVRSNSGFQIKALFQIKLLRPLALGYILET